MRQMKKVQVRLSDNNARQLKAIVRSMNRNKTLQTTLPAVVDYMLDKWGIPEFLKSELYKDAIANGK